MIRGINSQGTVTVTPLRTTGLATAVAFSDLNRFTGSINRLRRPSTKYMQARYYDPVIGRFLGEDPVTFMDTGDPVHFNRYAYANNDPVKMIDPDGRVAQFCLIPPVGAGVCAPIAKVAVEAVVVACIFFCGDVFDNPGDLPNSVPNDIPAPPDGVTDIAPAPTIDDLIHSAIGTEVKPLPGESVGEFDERITNECKIACIDQVVGESESGEESMSPIGGQMIEKIRQCTNACRDSIWEGVSEEDFEE